MRRRRPMRIRRWFRAVADLLLEQRGGDGFVRAFVERLFDITQLSEEAIDELVSSC